MAKSGYAIFLVRILELFEVNSANLSEFESSIILIVTISYVKVIMDKIYIHFLGLIMSFCQVSCPKVPVTIYFSGVLQNGPKFII